MKMDMLIDELQEIIEGAITLPLSGGKTVVNTERIKEIIDEMRTNLPQEVRQAKNIAADRSNIIAKSKEEAEAIVQRAEERAKNLISQAEDKAKVLVSQNEIVKQAKQQADEIIAAANNESVKIKQAANVYVDNVLKKADDQLSENLAAVKKTRQSLKDIQKKRQSGKK